MHPRANDQVQLAQPIPERDSPAVINVLADDETHPIILIANDNYVKLARCVTQRLPNKLFKLTASSRKIRAGRPWLNTTGSVVPPSTLPFAGAAAA